MIALWLVFGVVMGAVFFAVLVAPDPEPEVELPGGYTQDIDFSLAIKGYPVVNEVDIQYSEWLAANPGKVV